MIYVGYHSCDRPNIVISKSHSFYLVLKGAWRTFALVTILTSSISRPWTLAESEHSGLIFDQYCDSHRIPPKSFLASDESLTSCVLFGQTYSVMTREPQCYLSIARGWVTSAWYSLHTAEGATKEFIYQDGKVKFLEAISGCNLKIWPPYWKHAYEQ